MNNEIQIDYTKFYGLVLHIKSIEMLDKVSNIIQNNNHFFDESIRLEILDGKDGEMYNFFQISCISKGWWLGPKFSTDKEIDIQEFERLILN